MPITLTPLFSRHYYFHIFITRLRCYGMLIIAAVIADDVMLRYAATLFAIIVDCFAIFSRMP